VREEAKPISSSPRHPARSLHSSVTAWRSCWSSRTLTGG
jgi:hypothetical protein